MDIMGKFRGLFAPSVFQLSCFARGRQEGRDKGKKMSAMENRKERREKASRKKKIKVIGK